MAYKAGEESSALFETDLLMEKGGAVLRSVSGYAWALAGPRSSTSITYHRFRNIYWRMVYSYSRAHVRLFEAPKVE